MTASAAAPTNSFTVPTLTLSETDQAHLHTVVHRGRTSARTRTRAQVLLKLSEGWSDLAVAHAFDICRNTVKRVRPAFWKAGWMRCSTTKCRSTATRR